MIAFGAVVGVTLVWQSAEVMIATPSLNNLAGFAFMCGIVCAVAYAGSVSDTERERLTERAEEARQAAQKNPDKSLPL
jgi:hypothetical protein